MDSSSEDDDIYINAASKLNALNSRKISKFRDDNVDEEDEHLVEEVVEKEKNSASSNSTQIGKTTTNNIIPIINDKENIELEHQVISSSDDDDEDIVCIGAEHNTLSNPTGRITRSSSKRSISSRVQNSFNDSIEQELNRDDSFQLSQDENDSYVMIGSPPPTKKMNLDDYEVTIKVLWKSNKVERFDVRRHETLQKVFKYFGNLEGVSEDQIFITKKEKPIKPFDTPASIDWTILDILDGGIVSAEVAKKNKVNSANLTGDIPENLCKIKIQTSDKRTLTVTMKHDANFEVLLKNCSEQLEISESKIKFYFDGDLIDIDETPDSLDIEDEACFDLKLIP